MKKLKNLEAKLAALLMQYQDMARAGIGDGKAAMDVRREAVAVAGELLPLLREFNVRFNFFVSTRVEAKKQEFLATISPYFGGGAAAKQTAREFEYVHIPAVAELRRAFIEAVELLSCGPLPTIRGAETILGTARRVIAHAVKCCQEFGWGDAATLALPPRPPTPKPVQPPPVRARVKQSMRIDALAAALGRRNLKRRQLTDPEFLTFRAGEEVVVPGHMWRGLARYFDPIDGTPGAGTLKPKQ